MSVIYKWSAEEEHLLRLLRPTNSFQEIAEEFSIRHDKNLPGFRTLRSADAIRRKCERENITPENAVDTVSTANENHWQAIEEIQKQYKSQSIKKTTGLIGPEKVSRKILSLSDIHFPLARLDLLAQAVEEHSDADIVVLNGDILEGHIFSTYEKHRRIAAIDEYNSAFNFVQFLSENFPKVVLVEGNHDDRASRLLRSTGMPKEATQILRPCLIARIANGERLDSTGMLVEKLDFKNVVFQQRESWYVKIGKTLFIHPSSRGSSKPGWTVASWNKKFLERYSRDEYDSIVCGHTHQIYKGIENSILLIEQGCLVDLLGYSWDRKIPYLGNGQNGYAVIYQDAEGNTDFNLSGPIFLGEVLPPKKSVL